MYVSMTIVFFFFPSKSRNADTSAQQFQILMDPLSMHYKGWVQCLMLSGLVVERTVISSLFQQALVHKTRYIYITET